MTSGEGWPQAVKSCRSTAPASENEEARKKTQARQTTLNVTIRRAQIRNGVSGGSGRPSAVRRSRRQCSKTSAVPWIPPHTTNVHDAPCQSPPSSIVSIRFTYVRALPFRFPPSGM